MVRPSRLPTLNHNQTAYTWKNFSFYKFYFYLPKEVFLDGWAYKTLFFEKYEQLKKENNFYFTSKILDIDNLAL